MWFENRKRSKPQNIDNFSVYTNNQTVDVELKSSATFQKSVQTDIENPMESICKDTLIQKQFSNNDSVQFI